jgi:hypothetical protein
VRNEIETKRNETKSTKTKRNEINKNETKRNQRNENEIKRNQRKQNEIENGRKNNRGLKEIGKKGTFTRYVDFFKFLKLIFDRICIHPPKKDWGI